MSEEIVEMHAKVSGFVQGVGFRYTVLALAEKLALTGTVRNHADGSVEIFAQGRKSILEDLIAKLKNQGPGHVDKVVTNFYAPNKMFSDFRIVN